MSNSKMDCSAWRERVRKALQFSRAIISFFILFMVEPGHAGSLNCSSCDPTTQMAVLRERLQALRSQQPQVSLSFTGIHQAFATHHTDSLLRLRDCTYDVESDMAGLIDILLAADIRVGYPAGWESYQPEARFGVYFAPDSPDGLDLWFSNPLTPREKAVSEDIVLGQSYDRYDRDQVTAYKIAAAPALRDQLWAWTRDHGHLRPDTASECQTLEKYDRRQPSPK